MWFARNVVIQEPWEGDSGQSMVCVIAAVKWESWETSIQEMWIRHRKGDTECSMRTSVRTHTTQGHYIYIYIYMYSSPNTSSFALYQKKASSMKQADLRDMFKKGSKSVCTSTVVVSPDPLSPTPSSCEDSRKHRRGPRWPWASRWRYTNGILLSLVVQPKYRSSDKKITCKNFDQYRYCLIIWNIQ
jgi:hypothetical protein